MNRSAKTAIRITVGLVLFSSLSALLYAFYLSGYIGPVIERHRARKALADATPSTLESAVGPLGAVFHYPDGSWLAIRYRDSHGILWSLATALDSERKWFESTEHFCGNFMLARNLSKEEPSIFEKLASESDSEDNLLLWIHSLDTAPNLPKAHEMMKKYFKQLE